MSTIYQVEDQNGCGTGWWLYYWGEPLSSSSSSPPLHHHHHYHRHHHHHHHHSMSWLRKLKPGSLQIIYKTRWLSIVRSMMVVSLVYVMNSGVVIDDASDAFPFEQTAPPCPHYNMSTNGLIWIILGTSIASTSNPLHHHHHQPPKVQRIQ